MRTPLLAFGCLNDGYWKLLEASGRASRLFIRHTPADYYRGLTQEGVLISKFREANGRGGIRAGEVNFPIQLEQSRVIIVSKIKDTQVGI